VFICFGEKQAQGLHLGLSEQGWVVRGFRIMHFTFARGEILRREMKTHFCWRPAMQ